MTGALIFGDSGSEKKSSKNSLASKPFEYWGRWNLISGISTLGQYNRSSLCNSHIQVFKNDLFDGSNHLIITRCYDVLDCRLLVRCVLDFCLICFWLFADLSSRV